MTSNQIDSARPDKDGYRTDPDISVTQVWTKWVLDRYIVGYFKRKICLI